MESSGRNCACLLKARVFIHQLEIERVETGLIKSYDHDWSGSKIRHTFPGKGLTRDTCSCHEGSKRCLDSAVVFHRDGGVLSSC